MRHSIRLAIGIFVRLLLSIGAVVSPGVAVAQDADQRFTELLDAWWQDQLERHPLKATYAGDHRYNDRLDEISVVAAQREQRHLAEVQRQLADIDAGQLAPSHQLNYRILTRILGDRRNEFAFRTYLIPITNREGFHISFPELRHAMPFRSVRDYENYIARLRAFRDFARGHIEVMRAGIGAGMVLPAVVLERYAEPIEAHIVAEPTQSLLYGPLREMPEAIPADRQETLRTAAREAISDSVVPGYRDFLQFMQDEYVPQARGSIGAAALPQGRDLYRYRVRRFTTLDLTPEQVHETGLAEVERIRGEMQQILERVGFEGEIREFADQLRTDARFHADSPETLMKEVAYVLKKIDGRLPELFKTLPRTPYGIKPIPDYIAPQTTSAYYQPPPGDLTRGGFYFVNTYDLRSRPLYEIEALSLHEAVPGHHLQLALQMELASLHPFRRFTDFTAFIEGWALYAERLGLEVGFYEDPYSDFGRLTYEMWRACRLVVDTGIHYFGWTREQAIELMADNTALSLHNIRSEVDRYIAWPGQALAYKIGELKIRQLRHQAEEQLADRFNLREFHDVVLREGSIPMDVLTENVAAWIEATK